MILKPLKSLMHMGAQHGPRMVREVIRNPLKNALLAVRARCARQFPHTPYALSRRLGRAASA
jgi:hypothetical protein